MDKLITPTMLVLTITLVITYISKKKKSKLVAALFAAFGFAGISLLMIILYDEVVVGRHDWWRFIALSGVLIAMIVCETLEILGKFSVADGA